MTFIKPSTKNIGSDPAHSVFTSYLVNELIESKFYDEVLSKKTPEEQETYKTKLTELWFKVLSHETTVPGGGLHFAIVSLSKNRNWTHTQIQKFCSVLNYSAEQEVMNNPYSWNVFYMGAKCSLPSKKTNKPFNPFG